MTVRILCPGPSLADYRPGDYTGPTIGINRAALAHACTIWAATDYPVIRDYGAKVMGNPFLLTRLQTAVDARAKMGRFRGVAHVEDIRPAPPGRDWQLKTLTCAMVSAAACGATRIELYGCDWAGTLDYDGVAAGEDRTPVRWAVERRDVEAVAWWLRERGCTVIRAGAAPSAM